MPVGARFSARVQIDPGPHPASFTMSTWSFEGVKRPARGINHPSPSNAEVKERVELRLWALWPILGGILLLPFTKVDERCRSDLRQMIVIHVI
jgi:hypothetical protein